MTCDIHQFPGKTREQEMLDMATHGIIIPRMEKTSLTSIFVYKCPDDEHCGKSFYYGALCICQDPSYCPECGLDLSQFHVVRL